MKEISQKVIDIYDDMEFEGMEKIAKCGLPESVKSMKLMNSAQLSQLADDDFGLICFDKYANKVRRYPINDRENSWLSAQYFDKTASALTPRLRENAAYRIKTACQRFDINDYPQSLDGKPFKKENTEQVYALRNEYPLHDERFVKLAAGFFNKYASQFSDPKDRNTYASNVIKRAKELNIEIQPDHYESLTKYASEKLNPCLDMYLEQRKSMLSGKEKEVYFLEKLAEVKTAEKPQDIADALYKFDKKAGLSKYWDSNLKDPYSAVMGCEKKAMSFRFDDLGDGDMTDADLMEVLKGDKIKSYLGDDFTKFAMKNPVAIFESLPDQHKQIIYQIYKKEI